MSASRVFRGYKTESQTFIATPVELIWLHHY